jgi:hypothetical protein
LCRLDLELDDIQAKVKGLLYIFYDGFLILQKTAEKEVDKKAENKSQQEKIKQQ